MKFSVLMSVYINDSPVYLRDALVSIFDNQTRKPDEIIIVFDGPLTSDLYKVLEDFRNEKKEIVKYYPQEHNRGLGEALRIGSEKCTGDYIFRMDADDISVPTRFESQISYIKEHPYVDVLGSSIAEFYTSPNEKNKRIRRCPQTHEKILNMGKKRNPMNHVSVCIKRESLFKAGGYLPLRYLEDYFLWMRMINKGCVFENISFPLVNVRIGNGFEKRRGYKEQIKSWKILQDFLVDKSMITSWRAMLNMYSIRIFVYSPSWLKKIVYLLFLRKAK